MYFRNSSEELDTELNNEDISFQDPNLEDDRHKHHKDECEDMDYMECPMMYCPMMHENPMMHQCPMMHEQPMMYEYPMMHQEHMKSSSDTKCYKRDNEEDDEMSRQHYYDYHNRPNYYHHRPRPYYPPYFNPYFLPYYFLYGYPQHRPSEYMHYNHY